MSPDQTKNKQLKVGQVAELLLKTEEKTFSLPATVQESRLGEHVLSVASLTRAPEEMAKGTEIVLRFADYLGLHEIRCEIVDTRSGKQLEITLGEVQARKSVQRRDFFRADARLQVEVSVMVSKTEKVATRDQRGVSIDISAGGIRLDTRLILQAGDLISVFVHVPAALQRNLPKILGCHAKVLRSEAVLWGGVDLWRIAAQFNMVDETERASWVRLALDIARGVGG